MYWSHMRLSCGYVTFMVLCGPLALIQTGIDGLSPSPTQHCRYTTSSYVLAAPGEQRHVLAGVGAVSEVHVPLV